MSELDDFMAKIINGTGITFQPKSPDAKTYFPGGFKWRYYMIERGNRKWRFCWSVSKNGNGKWVSWIYAPVPKQKGRFTKKRLVEHRRKKSAKARASKLFNQFYSKTKKEVNHV